MLQLCYAWLGLTVDASVKAVLLAALAGAALVALRVGNANVRHRAWTAVLAGMLVLPLLPPLMPGLPLPLVPLPELGLGEGQSPGTRPTAEMALTAGRRSKPSQGRAEQPEMRPSAFSDTPPFATVLPDHVGSDRLSQPAPVSSTSQMALQRDADSHVRNTATVAPAASPTSLRAGWPLFLFAAYLSVFGALAFRLLVGVVGTLRLVQGARPAGVDCPSVLIDGQEQSAAVQRDARPEARRSARLATRTTVLESPLIRLPLTVGWLRPKILLPAEWSAWPQARFRSVISHELAHIHRGDYLVTLLAEWNRCLYWFHPLARTSTARSFPGWFASGPPRVSSR